MRARKTALIVDDEPDVIAYLSAVLEANDFEVHTADNTENGLKLAVLVKPDIICLDIMIPKESGLSLYTKLCGHGELADIPVVIISGIQPEREFDFRSFVQNSSVPPPKGYFEKPIDIDRFVQTVMQLVQGVQPRSHRNENKVS